MHPCAFFHVDGKRTFEFQFSKTMWARSARDLVFHILSLLNEPFIIEDLAATYRARIVSSISRYRVAYRSRV
jgi:hypothetical protein